MIQILISTLFLFFADNRPKQLDPCEVYGKVYVINDPHRADYRIYIEE